MPEGIFNGFATILLPFLVTRAGLPAAAAASATAIALLPYVMAALCGPIIDLSLTLRRWYCIALFGSAVMFILITAAPIRRDTIGLLTAAAFCCEIGAVLICVTVAAIIARIVPDSAKGRAGGWYQAGLLGGAGLGGGGGIWLTAHTSTSFTSFILVGTAVASATALRFLPALPVVRDGRSLKTRLVEVGRDLVELVREPQGRLVTLLVVSPIGVGAATNLWSAIAIDWHTAPNLVALVTGAVNGLAAAIGCIVGGRMADQIGRLNGFFGSGLMMAVVAVAMAAAPRNEAVFGSGVMLYSLSQGWANAAYSALALYVISRGAVASKYAILTSLGNIPVSYMTAFDGYVHDRWSAAGMLTIEALIGVACVAVALLPVRRLRLTHL